MQDVCDNIFSADYPAEFSIVENGYPSEMVFCETLSNIYQAVFFVEADDVFCHIILNFSGLVLDIVEKAEYILFGDDARNCHIIIYHCKPVILFSTSVLIA